MKQGEIWLINLDPTFGAEIKKTRPGIIVNNDTLGKLPLKIIVPLTDWKDRYEIAPWMIRIYPDAINYLSKFPALIAFRFVQYPMKDSHAKLANLMRRLRRRLKWVCQKSYPLSEIKKTTE